MLVASLRRVERAWRACPLEQPRRRDADRPARHHRLEQDAHPRARRGLAQEERAGECQTVRRRPQHQRGELGVVDEGAARIVVLVAAPLGKRREGGAVDRQRRDEQRHAAAEEAAAQRQTPADARGVRGRLAALLQGRRAVAEREAAEPPRRSLALAQRRGF